MILLASQVQQLNALIISGENLQAIERFYAEEVQIQENEGAIQVGKQAFWEREKQTLAGVKSLTATLLNQAVDPQKEVVFGEWEYIFTNHQNQVSHLVEVSVQQWENGLIVKEKFYYKQIIKQ